MKPIHPQLWPLSLALVAGYAAKYAGLQGIFGMRPSFAMERAM